MWCPDGTGKVAAAAQPKNSNSIYSALFPFEHVHGLGQIVHATSLLSPYTYHTITWKLSLYTHTHCLPTLITHIHTLPPYTHPTHTTSLHSSHTHTLPSYTHHTHTASLHSSHTHIASLHSSHTHCLPTLIQIQSVALMRQGFGT